MKEKVIAITLLVILISGVCVNTLFLTDCIGDIIDEVNDINIESNVISSTKKEAELIFEKYNQKITLISLTVSHQDLTSIEEEFVNMIAYLSVSDFENAGVAKSRLIHSLEHLRRLSGFNIDSVI